MARPSIESQVKEKVSQYIEKAMAMSPNAMPLSTLAVSVAVGHDRRVLKKYGQDLVIAAAEKKRAKSLRTGADEKRRSMEERLEAIQLENKQLEGQSNALLARLALIEGNAKRLGIDPEELYRPLVPPDRRVSAVFKGKGRRPSGSR
jgi:hypothetical protein